MCFPLNFAKFFKTSFLKNTSGRLLLYLLTGFCVSEALVLNELGILTADHEIHTSQLF